MAYQCGMLIVHGIGKQQAHYARNFINTVKISLQQYNINPNLVAFVPVHWQPIVGKNQQHLVEYSLQYGLSWRWLRNIFIEVLSDASSYHASYRALHQAIYLGLKALEEKLANPSLPLMMVAHSQGCAMTSDYIYDRLTPTSRFADIVPEGKSNFQKLQSLESLITLGANIPLFRMGYDQPMGLVIPNKDFIWQNFYGKSDILGYPLDAFYKAPENRVSIIDEVVRVGSWLTRWNPISHVSYWSDPVIIKNITHRLAQLLRQPIVPLDHNAGST